MLLGRTNPAEITRTSEVRRILLFDTKKYLHIRCEGIRFASVQILALKV